MLSRRRGEPKSLKLVTTEIVVVCFLEQDPAERCRFAPNVYLVTMFYSSSHTIISIAMGFRFGVE
jgi:hypothetical protein